MIQVERTTAASTAEVWRLLSDIDSWDDVLPTMDEVTRVGDGGPIGIGSRFRVRQPGLRPAVYEVTGWQPGQGFVWTSSQPGVRTTATHEVTQTADGTRLRLGIAWTGPLAGLVRLAFGHAGAADTRKEKTMHHPSDREERRHREQRR